MTDPVFLVVVAACLATGGLLCFAALRGRSLRRRIEGEPTKPRTTRDGQVNAVPDALIMGDVDHPLVLITPTADLDRQPMAGAVDPALRSALQPLLQRAPELFRIGQDVSGKTFRLIFSPEVTRALNKGTLELVPSAGELLPIARQVGNPRKFVKLGRVVATGGIRLANVAAASWQIAAIATAQHYLADINARLAGIERGIEEIQAWLTEEKRSELRASVRLLRDYFDAIARGELHEYEQMAIYHQLEDIERTCLAIAELALQTSKDRLEKLHKLEIHDWTARRKSAEGAIKWIRHCREGFDLVFLAHSVRAMACQVKASLPGDRKLVLSRLENSKEAVMEAQQLFQATSDAFAAKIKGLAKRKGQPLALDGVFDTDHRQKLSSEYSQARLEIEAAVQRLHQDATTAHRFSHSFQQLDAQGVTLDVRVNKEGVMELLSAGPTTTESPT